MTEGDTDLKNALLGAARYAAEVLALRDDLNEEREGYKLALILLLRYGRHREPCAVWGSALSPCSCGWGKIREDVIRDLRVRHNPAVDGPWPDSWAPAS